MKFVPNAIARKVAESQLLASEHSPTILFGAGVVGMIGSTVLACRATLKLESVLDEIEHTKRMAHRAKADVDSGEAEGVTYPDQEYRRDLALVSIQGVGKIAKLYAPAVIVGGVSVVCLTKSHHILRDRNAALVAAYTAIEGAFKNYREQVVEKYGEEEDRNFLYTAETVEIVDGETGEVVTTTRALDAPGSAYFRWWDELSSDIWSKDPDINLLVLKNVQCRMNDRLKLKGHVFLNEVYDALGMEHSKAGSLVGWRYPSENGDGFIDFGIWDGDNPAVIDFFNGRDGAVLLDFNVDPGVIYNQVRGGEDR
jgi:hypothetical protein